MRNTEIASKTVLNNKALGTYKYITLCYVTLRYISTTLRRVTVRHIFNHSFYMPFPRDLEIQLRA